MLKIYLGGFDSPSSFHGKIKKELLLKNEESPSASEADIIYFTSYNSEWDDLCKFKTKIKAKFILNVLDIPLNIWRFDQVKSFGEKLKFADKLTTISKFTKNQLKYYYGLDSTVVGCPIMNIKYENIRNESGVFKYLHVGRRADPNKNYALAPLTLKFLGEPYENLSNVGQDESQFGVSYGEVTEDKLNYLYNTHDFCFCLGKLEGLSLTIIESMSAGCIPVIINELTTRQEILPSDLFPEYDHCYKHPDHLSYFINKFKDNKYKIDFRNRLLNRYKDLEESFSARAVAKKINKVFDFSQP